MTFDCYGTLIDWEAGVLDVRDADPGDVVPARRHARAVGRALGAHSVSDAATLSALSRDPAAQLRRDDAVLRHRGVRRRRRRPGALDRRAGIPSPIRGARCAASRVAIASPSCPTSISDLLADSVGRLQAPFSCLVTAEEARAYKPDPKPLELAIAAARGSRPSRSCTPRSAGSTIWRRRARSACAPASSIAAASPPTSRAIFEVPSLEALAETLGA